MTPYLSDFFDTLIALRKPGGRFCNAKADYFIRRILTEFSRHSMETPVSANTATHILA